MPKTIPCWDCKGKGKIRIYPEHLQTGYHDIPCETCKGGGVLSVYTQDKVQRLKDAMDKMLKANTYIDRLMIIRKIWNKDGE